MIGGKPYGSTCATLIPGQPKPFKEARGKRVTSGSKCAKIRIVVPSVCREFDPRQMWLFEDAKALLQEADHE